MANITSRLRALPENDEGQDLIEYALLAGLISLVAVAAVTSVGTNINELFLVKVTDALKGANK